MTESNEIGQYIRAMVAQVGDVHPDNIHGYINLYEDLGFDGDDGDILSTVIGDKFGYYISDVLSIESLTIDEIVKIIVAQTCPKG